MTDHYDRLIHWSRCRSGKRWFWAAEWGEYMGYEKHIIHGRTDTEEQALAAGQAAAVQLADGEPAHIGMFHGVAVRIPQDLNAEGRAARPSEGNSDAAPVEYLYGVDFGSEFNDFARLAVKFRITKKTAKRIYYVRKQHPWDDQPDIGYVDRQELEANGEIWRRSGGWWETDAHLYLEPPVLEQLPEPPDLAELKRVMADAHPDRGGTSEAFMMLVAGPCRQGRRRRSMADPAIFPQDALTRALVNAAAKRQRPTCSDPESRWMWTSDKYAALPEGAKRCSGWVVFQPCLEVAEQRDEKWHVYGGKVWSKPPKGKAAG